MDPRTSCLTRTLGRGWSMPDEMLAKLVDIYAHNSQLKPDSSNRIGERMIVKAIRERYGIGVSTHTVAKWFRDNQEKLNELVG